MAGTRSASSGCHVLLCRLCFCNMALMQFCTAEHQCMDADQDVKACASSQHANIVPLIAMPAKDGQQCYPRRSSICA